ncbi:hypothetical protein [Nocardia vaccinii]|uniref:hypothetical protein n=1 Tax=Nocardia vaccinii TaxID=1822 RepID=UPI0012F4A290|nr:hypothetical protein [Nocardia vaccinii]
MAAAPVAPGKDTKKLSLEFPPDVHRALKAGAALLGVTMIGSIVEMCRARFMGAPWPADVVEQVRRQIEATQEPEPEPEPAPAARPRQAPARKRSGS